MSPKAIHQYLLPRKNAIERKSAGAADNVIRPWPPTSILCLIVSGLDFDFNLRRIERYLTMGI